MHTFNSAQEWFGRAERKAVGSERRGGGEDRGLKGELIINGADFGINQDRESRRASSRASEKTERLYGRVREGRGEGGMGRGEATRESVHRQRPN